MGFQFGRGGVVSGNNQYIWFEIQQHGQGFIDTFDDLYLAIKISIFAHAVCLFDMDEKEVVLLPMFGHGGKFIFGVFAVEFYHLHTDKI